MSAFDDQPDYSDGIRAWLSSLDDNRLEDVLEELRVAAVTLALAQAVKAQRQVDNLLAAAIGEAIPEVDSRAFLQSLKATGRLYRHLGMDLSDDDVLHAFDEAFEDSRRPPTHHERTH